MKIIYGVLIVGVSAIALGACSTSGGGPGAVANALLGSGNVGTDPQNRGLSSNLSDAGTDAKTSATITGDISAGTATVTIQGGGQVAGPRTYQKDTTNDVGDATNGVFNSSKQYEQFLVGKPTPTSTGPDSILVATGDNYAVTGFVGATAASGSGNIAAAYQVITAPTTRPTGTVTYYGDVAATAQKNGQSAEFISGQAQVAANFATGGVTGTFNFNHDVPNTYWDGTQTQTIQPFRTVSSSPLVVGFTGAMSTDKATYASSSVTVDSVAGSGNVIGAFAGPDYQTTVGAIDVQNADTTPTKITGAYIANSNVIN